jgi:hypothetical protein
MESVTKYLSAARTETRELGMTVAECVTAATDYSRPLSFDIQTRYEWIKGLDEEGSDDGLETPLSEVVPEGDTKADVEPETSKESDGTQS